jgi:N-ethylmaleimide reductase
MANPIFTKPLQLGEVTLSHPVIMAPLTRMRATPPPSLAPHELNVKYYEQRATPGGLLIGEASQISQQGAGYVEPTPLKVIAAVRTFQVSSDPGSKFSP